MEKILKPVAIKPELTARFSKVIDRNLLAKIFITRTLSFTMQSQIYSNWCWAATATSVVKFYTPASTWTQCKVACSEKGLSTCCSTPVPAACNTYGTLGSSLTTVGRFNKSEAASLTTFAKIKTEILAGRPVGARTAWSGGGAHFVAIYGFQEFGSTKYLMIDDPISGKQSMTWATFQTSYRNSGTWTHTYYTK